MRPVTGMNHQDPVLETEIRSYSGTRESGLPGCGEESELECEFLLGSGLPRVFLSRLYTHSIWKPDTRLEKKDCNPGCARICARCLVDSRTDAVTAVEESGESERRNCEGCLALCPCVRVPPSLHHRHAIKGWPRPRSGTDFQSRTSSHRHVAPCQV
jgi:hypothetical protein